MQGSNHIRKEQKPSLHLKSESNLSMCQLDKLVFDYKQTKRLLIYLTCETFATSLSKDISNFVPSECCQSIFKYLTCLVYSIFLFAVNGFEWSQCSVACWNLILLIQGMNLGHN